MNANELLKPDKSEYRAKNAFAYVTPTISSLAAAASTSNSIQIDGDADFFWTKLQIFATSGNDGTTEANSLVPAVSLLITNSETGRSYSNAPIFAPNFAGSAKLPFIMPMVTLINRKAILTVDWVNLTDNTTYTGIQLAFIGIKAYG